jgi:hypothetical protein
MKLSLLRRNSTSSPPPSPGTSPKTTPRASPSLAKWEEKLQQEASPSAGGASPNYRLPSPRTFIYPPPPPDLVVGDLRLPSPTASPRTGGGGAPHAASDRSPPDQPPKCSPRWVADRADAETQLLRAQAQVHAIAYVPATTTIMKLTSTTTTKFGSSLSQHNTTHQMKQQMEE